MALDISIFSEEKLRDPSKVESSAPRSLSDLDDASTVQDFLLEKEVEVGSVDLRVDYDSFSNFVCFNSAQKYFNVTGELILNEYPYDGDRGAIQRFQNDLDPYQRHVVNRRWPRWSGHLRLNGQSGSYVSFSDSGQDRGSTRTSMLSPGTGSFTVEVWFSATGVNALGPTGRMVLFQKQSPTGDISIWLESGSIRFSVSDAFDNASADTEFKSSDEGRDLYVAGVYSIANSTASVSLYTGSVGRFPVLTDTGTFPVAGGALNLGSSSFYIGTGDVGLGVLIPFSGTVGETRFWRVARTALQLSSSYNARTYAQDGLYGMWRFSEPRRSGLGGDRRVIDYSGHRLDGVIQNYHYSVAGSGSIITGPEDLVRDINDPVLVDYITTQQISGSEYDRSNQNHVTNFFPEQYFVLEQDRGTEVLQNILYVYARFFDGLKCYVDQLPRVTRTHYGDFDQAPDQLLEFVASYYGFQLKSPFSRASATQYTLGTDILPNVQSNEELDVKLYEVRNGLWRRLLNNLPYIYKTKGTRESVESVLRSLGIPRGYVRVKELGYTSVNEIQTTRAARERSDTVLLFSASDSVRIEVPVRGDIQSSFTVEGRYRFPTTSSSGMTATLLTSSLWSVFRGTQGYQLLGMRQSIDSVSGTILLTSSAGQHARITGSFFDSQWRNLSTVYDSLSGTLTVSSRRVELDEIELIGQSVAGSSLPVMTRVTASLGSVGRPAEYWSHEFRVWNAALDSEELDDHTLNYKSYGVRSSDRNQYLRVHVRGDEGILTGAISTIPGYAPYPTPTSGTVYGSNFGVSQPPYVRELFEYFHISPGDWTEEKIRVFDGSYPSRFDRPVDSRQLVIELNLVDALNEDISQMVSSLDEFELALGLGAVPYYESYPTLETMRRRYFRRLEGAVNFRQFVDMMEFFDRSILDMLRQLIPASALFDGEEIVVEPHMLERPKVVYRRRITDEGLVTVEGEIQMTIRHDGSRSFFLRGGAANG